MAILRTSALVADLRGSVGGNTFARNRGGLYCRSRVKPLNPSSPLQQLQRAYASAGAAAWGALTAAQRTAWQLYATNTSWTNKLGDSINIGGQAAFLRLYTLMATGLFTVPTGAPLAYGHASGTVATFTASEATQFPTLAEPSIGWDKDTDDDHLLIFAGMPQSPSRAMAPSRFRFLESFSGQVAVPPAFPLVLAAYPWPFTEDQRLSLRLVHIDPSERVSVGNVMYAFAAA